MATKSQVKRRPDGYLTCPVCYDLCVNPKYLLCHHTYCEMCLVKIKVESDLICKKCGNVSPIPKGGMKEMPDSFFCSRVANEVNLRSKLLKEEDTKCDHCSTKEGTAVALCLVCHTLMCDYCYEYHKNSKEYHDHIMMPLAEARVKLLADVDVKPKVKLAMCHEHDIELKFYCETCEQLVCHYCITKSHLNHHHDTVKKMADKHRNELNEIMESIQGMIDGLSAAQKTVKTMGDKINAQADDIDKDISKHYEQLEQLLRQQREDLRKEIQGTLLQKKNRVLIQLEQMEDIQTELECLKKLTDEIKKDEETLLLKKCILNDVKRLSDYYSKTETEPVESDTMKFVPLKEQKNLFPMFGLVYTAGFELVDVPEYAFVTQETELKIVRNPSNRRRSEVIVQVQSSRGDIIPVNVIGDSNGSHLASFVANQIGEVKISATINGQHIKGSPRSVMMHKNYCTINKSTKIIDDMGSAWGIAVSRDGTLAVSESNHYVWVFPSNDQPVKKFGGFGDKDGQFKKPHGVAFDDNDNLYVTDRSNHRVHKFTKDGNYVIPPFGQYGSGNGQLYCPAGIVIYNGYVYVVDHGNIRISVFQSDSGKFSHIIKNDAIRSPYYIAVSSKGQLLVTDNSDFCVLVFSVNGNYVAKYGMPGTGWGQLKNPIGLATDQYGFIFVCEVGNHRVSIFDKDGVFIHCFGSQGSDAGQFHSPYGMAVSPNGSIYVCDYFNKRVQVFSFI